MNILIFGNSGAGKSSLAKKLSQQLQCAHLDLDTLAWQQTTPVTRKPIEESFGLIDKFVQSNSDWIIEGCYTDLLTLVSDKSTEIIFLDIPINTCINNANNRPWESHKYSSKQVQDDNLPMLVNWISDYANRVDTFSYSAHKNFFNQYCGIKTKVVSNEQSNAFNVVIYQSEV